MLLCVSEAVTKRGARVTRSLAPATPSSRHASPAGPCASTWLGMKPRHGSPGPGYGVSLMRQLASEVVLRSGTGALGTGIMMRFDLAGPVAT